MIHIIIDFLIQYLIKGVKSEGFSFYGSPMQIKVSEGQVKFENPLQISYFSFKICSLNECKINNGLEITTFKLTNDSQIRIKAYFRYLLRYSILINIWRNSNSRNKTEKQVTRYFKHHKEPGLMLLISYNTTYFIRVTNDSKKQQTTTPAVIIPHTITTILRKNDIVIWIAPNNVTMGIGQNPYKFRFCIKTCITYESNKTNNLPINNKQNSTIMNLFIYYETDLVTIIQLSWNISTNNSNQYHTKIINTKHCKIKIHYYAQFQEPQLTKYDDSQHQDVQIKEHSNEIHKLMTYIKETNTKRQVTTTTEHVIITKQALFEEHTPKAVIYNDFHEHHHWPFILLGISVVLFLLLAIYGIIETYKKYKKKRLALNLYRTSLGKYLPGMYVNSTQV